MSGIKSIGLIICMLMVLMAYLKQIIPKGKTSLLMKSILSVFIMLSMIKGIADFDISKIKAMLETEYESEQESWNETVDLIENGLMDEMNRFLAGQNLKAGVVELEIVGNYDAFSVSRVVISGMDSNSAMNIISGRYQIDRSYIEVQNE